MNIFTTLKSKLNQIKYLTTKFNNDEIKLFFNLLIDFFVVFLIDMKERIKEREKQHKIRKKNIPKSDKNLLRNLMDWYDIAIRKASTEKKQQHLLLKPF